MLPQQPSFFLTTKWLNQQPMIGLISAIQQQMKYVKHGCMTRSHCVNFPLITVNLRLSPEFQKQLKLKWRQQ